MIKVQLSKVRSLFCRPVRGSLTECNLCGNKFSTEGWCTVFDALRDNPQNKIAKWDLQGQRIGSEIVKSLAAYMAVSHSLTSIDLSDNLIGGHYEFPQFIYTPEGPKAIAEAIAVASSLTACDLRYNEFDELAKQLLRDSVKDRPSFKLEL